MLLKFQNKDEIEIIYINNTLYFKAKNVCDILGFKNSREAVKIHCDSEGVASADTFTLTGKKKATFINEANLYALIFNVPKIFKTDTEHEKNIKDKAKLFQKWVFNNVLPTLRRTGSFTIQDNEKDNLLKHLDIEIQKQNVKVINAIKNKEGGVSALKDYHNEICKLHTGKTATELKKMAKESGKYKSKVYNSAREIVRSVDKPIAASMSIADQLAKANKNKSLKEICSIARLSIPLFKAIDDNKLEHNLEELKN